MTIVETKERLVQLEILLKISEKRKTLLDMEKESQAEDLWQDSEKAGILMSKISELKKEIHEIDELDEWLSIIELENGTPDDALQAKLEVLEQKSALSADNDGNNAILTIHAGTGGVDAMDWAEMLSRMYFRYVEQGSTEEISDRTLSIDRRGWKAEVIEEIKGEEAGIKKIVIQITGQYVHGLLKSEAGVHRLVRLSPFNAKNLRQTSFALVEVIPEISQTEKINIDEKDLRIDVYRSGGHGGQGVNTTDSAVRITHIPSGIVVAVQNERSQHQNKALAMKILQSKLVLLQKVQNVEEIAMLKGEYKEGSWGNQIRSYVFQPYQMVKDHRTEAETGNVQAVMNGSLKLFIESYLRNN